MRLTDIHPGDVLTYWHDAGIYHTIAFARVIRLGNKQVRVRGEGGEEGWKDPAFFVRKLNERDMAELAADGVKI